MFDLRTARAHGLVVGLIKDLVRPLDPPLIPQLPAYQIYQLVYNMVINGLGRFCNTSKLYQTCSQVINSPLASTDYILLSNYYMI